MFVRMREPHPFIFLLMKQLCLLVAAIICASQLHAQITPAHTVIVILENKSYEDIVGNPAAPFINSLMSNPHTATLTNSYALARPSQPNYIMLFSGSAQGVTTNNVPLNLPFTTPNIGAALINSGKTFTGYSEDLPYVGFADSASGAYVRKHNPWVNWQGLGANTLPASVNRPWSDFPDDFNSLPTLSIVIPNQNNDMHDGPISTGDTWIKDSLGAYVNWCITNNSLFILTFDEDNNNGLHNNHILTLFVGANVNGESFNQPVTHYNVLRTLEELYQLPYAGFSADSSAIRGIWSTALPLQLTNFRVEKLYPDVKLSWDGSANGIASYAIERSSDGIIFSTIGSVNASGLHYSFTDPSAGYKNFYRIKEITTGGKSNYSNILKVVLKQPKISFTIAPNPAKDIVRIRTDVKDDTDAHVLLISEAGDIIQSHNAQLLPQQSLAINTAACKPGMYYIKIVAGDSATIKKLLIK